MKQKRISFKVAKAIKEAGYPQERNFDEAYYTAEGTFANKNYFANDIITPSYLDIWL